MESGRAKEYYYRSQFDSWGKYHFKFSYSRDEYIRHLRFLNWLFPEKDFKQWDVVVWHNPEAVTYYHNLIFELAHGKVPHWRLEILNQIKKWRIGRSKIAEEL